VTKPPEWPYRCPREGKYLSNVDAIWCSDIHEEPMEPDGIDPDMPILVYGTCKTHGRVWLSDPVAYQPHLWRQKHERKLARHD
jgi:hypothetical protein